MSENQIQSSAAGNLPFVSIIIPVCNGERTIAQAIKGCLEQDYPENRLEVTVVDDGSRDRTKEIVSTFPVKYIYQENAGPAKARNRGRVESGGEFIFCLDSDCIPEKNWVSETLSLYTSSGIACVGAKYTIANPGILLSRCAYAEFLVRYSRMPLEVKFTGSGVCTFRRSALEEVGGYDENYIASSGEDNDLCFKLIERGYKIVLAPNITVAHFFPAKIHSYFRTQFKHGYWRMKMYKDHPRMMKGENYATPLDFIQPPLMLLATLLIPCVLFRRSVLYPVLMMFTAGILLQLPFSMAMLKLRKRKEALLYIPLGLIRAMFRGWGMFFGILRFWIQDTVCRQKKS